MTFLLLGIAIYKKLTLKEHIENLCRKTQYKLHALRRMRKFLTIKKAKILGNAFIHRATNKAFTLALCELSLRLLAEIEISKFVPLNGYLSSVSL